MSANWIDEMNKIIIENENGFTFSINCHSGIAHMISPEHQCGCWRCRLSRCQEWTEETEAQASRDSKAAQAKWKQHLFCWLERKGIKV